MRSRLAVCREVVVKQAFDFVEEREKVVAVKRNVKNRR